MEVLRNDEIKLSIWGIIKEFVFRRYYIRIEEYTGIHNRWAEISTNNICYLIREEEGLYIVFLDSQLDIDWITSNNYDEENKNNKAYIVDILSKIENLQHEPTVSFLSYSMKKNFKCLLAESLVYVFDNQFELANSSIEKSKKYIRNRNFEISRKWHLQYSLLFMLVFIFIAVCIIINKQYLSELFNISTEKVSRYIYIVFGAIGASLSIIQKTGKRYYNAESGRYLHALEAVSRLIAGMISSLFAICLIQLDLVFTNFKTIGEPNQGMIIISIIAGFCERFVPSMITKFETIEYKRDKSNNLEKTLTLSNYDEED